MAVEHNVMSDDLLRQIIGVGRVDLLVGVPHVDDDDEALAVIPAVRAAFRSHFPRQRAALLYAGVGSDPLAAAVRNAWDSAAIGPRGGLRTTHLIAFQHTSADAQATRVMLAAADLLQAGTLVVLDPEAGDVTPERLAALTAPLQAGDVDLVAPLYTRPADEGVLVSQLLRPLTRALFCRDLREPLLPEFACSSQFASYCAQADPDRQTAQWRTQYWIAAEALARPCTLDQRPMGRRGHARRAARGGLPQLFQQVVSSAFMAIEHHAPVWTRREGAAAAVAAPVDMMASDPAAVGARAIQTFKADVGNLNEILGRILPAGVHDAVRQAANDGQRLDDALWADVVSEFLLAHHQAVMLREHVVQALLPLYLARVGTFLLDNAASSPDALEAALESVCQAFERVKPRLVEQWAHTDVR